MYNKIRELPILKFLGVILVAAGIYIFGMQYADGPNGLVRGGHFVTGELAEPPVNWSFLKGRMEIEFQTFGPDTSRVVWLAVLDEHLYIVSGYMNTTLGKFWKQWPHRLERDNRIILRVDGKLYEQRLKRLMVHPRLPDLMSIYSEKYGVRLVEGSHDLLQASLTDGDFWLFEVVER